MPQSYWQKKTNGPRAERGEWGRSRVTGSCRPEHLSRIGLGTEWSNFGFTFCKRSNFGFTFCKRSNFGFAFCKWKELHKKKVIETLAWWTQNEKKTHGPPDSSSWNGLPALPPHCSLSQFKTLWVRARNSYHLPVHHMSEQITLTGILCQTHASTTQRELIA